MQRLTFTAANGQQIKMDTRPFRLLTLQGAGAIQADIQTQKAPYQDGATYIDALLEPRSLLLEVAIMAENNERLYQYRRKLAQVFNPKLGPGLLRYEYDGGTKEIEAVAELAPEFPTGRDNRMPGFQRAILSLVCPSPFWLEPYEEGAEMAAWLGGLKFALELPTMFSKQASEIIVNNPGDVSTPVVIEFFGPATNPRVDNLTTGGFIRVTRELAKDEKLVISTAFGDKHVKLVEANGNESNAMHWIDLDSVFWQLEPGENTLRYSADAGADEARVKVTWKARYVGV